MLETVRKAFRVEDVRKRILYTFMMLVVVRLGSQLPTPGVNPAYIQNFFANQTGDAFNFFDAFTGGSFTQMSVFALSITPYITSSIIMHLFQLWNRDGQKLHDDRRCDIWCNAQCKYGLLRAVSNSAIISRIIRNDGSTTVRVAIRAPGKPACELPA